MAAISERATAIFSSHKHKVSGMLEPQHGPYTLALVGAMLGLNQKQLGETAGPNSLTCTGSQHAHRTAPSPWTPAGCGTAQESVCSSTTQQPVQRCSLRRVVEGTMCILLNATGGKPASTSATK